MKHKKIMSILALAACFASFSLFSSKNNVVKADIFTSSKNYPGGISSGQGRGGVFHISRYNLNLHWNYGSGNKTVRVPSILMWMSTSKQVTLSKHIGTSGTSKWAYLSMTGFTIDGYPDGYTIWPVVDTMDGYFPHGGNQRIRVNRSNGSKVTAQFVSYLKSQGATNYGNAWHYRGKRVDAISINDYPTSVPGKTNSDTKTTIVKVTGNNTPGSNFDNSRKDTKTLYNNIKTSVPYADKTDKGWM